MWQIFKNDNEWNEKTVVGFIAFLVMVLFALLEYIWVVIAEKVKSLKET